MLIISKKVDNKLGASEGKDIQSPLKRRQINKIASKPLNIMVSIIQTTIQTAKTNFNDFVFTIYVLNSVKKLIIAFVRVRLKYMQHFPFRQ